jgi:hypothetical protein
MSRSEDFYVSAVISSWAVARSQSLSVPSELADRTAGRRAQIDTPAAANLSAMVRARYLSGIASLRKT